MSGATCTTWFSGAWELGFNWCWLKISHVIITQYVYIYTHIIIYNIYIGAYWCCVFRSWSTWVLESSQSHTDPKFSGKRWEKLSTVPVLGSLHNLMIRSSMNQFEPGGLLSGFHWMGKQVQRCRTKCWESNKAIKSFIDRWSSNLNAHRFGGFSSYSNILLPESKHIWCIWGRSVILCNRTGLRLYPWSSECLTTKHDVMMSTRWFGFPHWTVLSPNFIGNILLK